MKHLYLFLLACISFFITQAQIVNIPDVNFKNTLINEFCVDTDLDGYPDAIADLNNDGEISVGEAGQIYSLYLNNRGISDLTGIESFGFMSILDCSNNNLATLDFSSNSSLKNINCSFNQLTSLDISQNVRLEHLNAFLNINLGNVDVSQNIDLRTLILNDCAIDNNLNIVNNIALTKLDIGYNNVNNIDLTQNINLEDLSLVNTDYTSLDLSFFTNLKILTIAINDFSTIDVSQNINLINLTASQNELLSLDVTNNTLLEKLTVNSNLLSDLDLSQNINLETLDFTRNNINTIDLTNNINLNRIAISENNLQALDVSQNVKIETLFCRDNQISSLVVSDLPFLFSLVASDNPITNMDVTQNSVLGIIGLSETLITSLDISNNTNIHQISLENNQFLENINFKNNNNNLFDQDEIHYEYVYYSEYSSNLRPYFNATNNPSLQTICVDDIAYATSTFVNIDATTVFVEDCSLAIIENQINNTIKVYPNPVSNKLYLESKNQLESISIYDVNGRYVKNIQLIGNKLNSEINTSTLSIGIYFVKIKTEVGVQTTKIIKTN